jgi:hypothetical protein
MIALLSRLFGSVIIGVCLSGFVIVLMTLFLGVRNLPNILAVLQRLIRIIFRGSYQFYRFVLSPVRVWFFQAAGIDIFQPIIRMICTLCLSLMIGAGLFTLFSWQISNWYMVVLGVHGFFVGLAWENILRSDEFQMGVNLE